MSTVLWVTLGIQFLWLLALVSGTWFLRSWTRNLNRWTTALERQSEEIEWQFEELKRREAAERWLP